jgi:hypothetical protein
MSNTIRLTEDGDLSFNQVGRLNWIVDENEKKVQSISLRLKTLKEELFYEEGYGHPTIKGKVDKLTLNDYFKDALLDDTDIESIEIINFKKVKSETNTGIYEVDIEIYLVSGEIIEFMTEV